MMDQFDWTIKRDYLRYNPVDDSEENSINPTRNPHKMQEIGEIQEEFKKLKFDLKSMLLRREDIEN